MRLNICLASAVMFALSACGGAADTDSPEGIGAAEEVVAISALAIAAPHQIVRAEAAEETHGDWRVMCENGVCNAYQIGTGGAAPVILRVLRGDPPAPEVHIEGGPFDAAGLVSFILDGRDRGGGPAAPGRTGAIDTIVLEPDDITLGLSRQMKKAASLSIEVPSSRGAETIEFGLDGYGAALERVQKSAD